MAAQLAATDRILFAGYARGDDLAAGVAGVSDDGFDALLSIGNAVDFPRQRPRQFHELGPIGVLPHGRDVSGGAFAVCHSQPQFAGLIVKMAEVGIVRHVVVGQDDHQTFVGGDDVAEVDQRLDQPLAADLGACHRQEHVRACGEFACFLGGDHPLQLPEPCSQLAVDLHQAVLLGGEIRGGGAQAIDHFVSKQPALIQADDELEPHAKATVHQHGVHSPHEVYRVVGAVFGLPQGGGVHDLRHHRAGPCGLRSVEGEFGVAERQDVAALEFHVGDAFAVDEGSVRTVKIVDGVNSVLAVDYCVPPRDPP